MNKEFLSILERSKEIHIKKNQDYTSGINVDENFERVAEIQSWFNNPLDTAFASFIAVKLARIASLLNKSSNPNFESIDDTFVDLVTYAGLWGGNVIRRIEFNKELNYYFSTNDIFDKIAESNKRLDNAYQGEDSLVTKRLKGLEVLDTNNPKQKKIRELIELQYNLTNEDYRELLSLARILKSRKV